MELVQVLNGVSKHVDDAHEALDAGDEASAKDSLADAAGLIQREIGDTNAVDEEPKAKEETEKPVGHCQPDQTNEEGS